MSEILLPYSINLANLMIRGNQTNPLIKDFLRQFSEPFDPNAPADLSRNLEEEYEVLESGFARDEAISEINKNLQYRIDEFTASLYSPTEARGSPRKSQGLRQTRARMELEREEAERRMARERKEKMKEARKAQMKKRTTLEDLRRAEEEHQKLIQKFPTTNKKFVEEKEVPKETIAKRMRENQLKFGASTLAENRKTLPKTVKPVRSKPVKEEKAPPKATDLANYSKRVNMEVKKFAELKDMIMDDEREEVNATEAFARMEDIQAEAFENQPLDYHMQLAMLFQKLENAEKKIRELDEKTDILQ